MAPWDLPNPTDTFHGLLHQGIALGIQPIIYMGSMHGEQPPLYGSDSQSLCQLGEVDRQSLRCDRNFTRIMISPESNRRIYDSPRPFYDVLRQAQARRIAPTIQFSCHNDVARWLIYNV